MSVNADRINDNKVQYCFMTAWSPPIQLIQYLAPLWPDLHFRLIYYEPGMCFAGELYCQGDNEVHMQLEDPDQVEDFGATYFGAES